VRRRSLKASLRRLSALTRRFRSKYSRACDAKDGETELLAAVPMPGANASAAAVVNNAVEDIESSARSPW